MGDFNNSLEPEAEAHISEASWAITVRGPTCDELKATFVLRYCRENENSAERVHTANPDDMHSAQNVPTPPELILPSQTTGIAPVSAEECSPSGINTQPVARGAKNSPLTLAWQEEEGAKPPHEVNLTCQQWIARVVIILLIGLHAPHGKCQ